MTWKNSEIYMQYFHQMDIAWIMHPYGWCFTFNIFDDIKLYHKNSIAEYFKPQNLYYYDYYFKSAEYDSNLVNNTKSPPLVTTQSTLGLDILILMSFNQYYQCASDFADCKLEDIRTTVIVHSPYEMPDMRHQKFVTQESDLQN